MTLSNDRQISGEIVFPPEAVPGVAARVLIELRDVSMQDAPSSVIASQELAQVPVGPNARLRFDLAAPRSPPGRALAMRAQVDMTPGKSHAKGDFLTTVSCPVAPDGDAAVLVVPLTKL